MKRVRTKAELVALAKELGVRRDWHEPDEQNVTASTHGVEFDNAGFWGDPEYLNIERHVKLYKGGKAVAVVNLATLFAWATGLED